MPDRVETIQIDRSLPGERLDSFLRSKFPVVSRGTIQRLLEQGYITVNDRPAKATQAPKAGDVVVVRWPEARPPEAQPEDIALKVLHEDEDLLVLNKAPGIVVHPSAGHDQHTLVNALLHHCRGQLSGIGGVARPGIVHRLDKETSGCLVVAKNDSTHLALAEQFASREVVKIYHAIVCGNPVQTSGEIEEPIGRHPTQRKKMTVRKGEREAWTSFRVLERFTGAAYMEANLHTGRTHQVRVHFHHLGYPILGDELYGVRQNNKFTETSGIKAPRQMLHAYQLEFRHPKTGKKLSLEAPLPDDFLGVLRALRK
jgi:23S rRNA pseudouridine1911/1915/1917 synthase